MEAGAGDLFPVPPGTLHALRGIPGEAMEYENIIFDLALLGGVDDLCDEKYLLPLQSGRLALPAHLTPGFPGYTQVLVCLHEAEEANRTRAPGYELEIKGALLRLLGLLVAQSGSLPSAENTDTRRLKTVLQLISQHYAEDLPVSAAAAACGCSTSHFMRWFKQMTGHGFTAFLKDYRLNAAAEALRLGDEPILTVAEQAGFRNLSYFNRAFKTQFGLTPRDYRRER